VVSRSVWMNNGRMWRMGSPKTRGLHRRCPVAKAGCLSETCYVKEIILQTFHPRTRSAKHETNRNEQQHTTLVAQCMLTRTTSICQQQISVHTTQQQETGQYTFPALNQLRFSHSVQNIRVLTCSLRCALHKS